MRDNKKKSNKIIKPLIKDFEMGFHSMPHLLTHSLTFDSPPTPLHTHRNDKSMRIPLVAERERFLN